jgi:methyltransferase
VETGAAHYPAIVAVHASWLGANFLAIPPEAAMNLPLLMLFCALQAGRIWVIASLGPYWTTRIISVPGQPLVRHGPYRFMRHPNYAVVAAEIACLPLIFGAWMLAVVFSVANGAVLAWRIQAENRALLARREVKTR